MSQAPKKNAGDRLLRTDAEQKVEPMAQAESKSQAEGTKPKSSVLVIDSDPLMLTAMGSILDMQGHRAVMARDEAMAMQQIQAGQFDVIVLNIEKLEVGCAFAQNLRGFEATQDIPVIFLVPDISQDWDQELAKHGGVFSMKQPVEPEELIECVEKALWMPHVARGRAGANSTRPTRQNDWVSL